MPTNLAVVDPMNMSGYDPQLSSGRRYARCQFRCVLQTDVVHETDPRSERRMMEGHDNRSALRIRDRAVQVLKARLAQSAASQPFDQRIKANDQGAGDIGGPVDQPLSRYLREVPEHCTQPLAAVMISGHDQNPPSQEIGRASCRERVCQYV